eukprot:5822743-Alexandrium_andersonii.AAC.1
MKRPHGWLKAVGWSAFGGAALSECRHQAHQVMLCWRHNRGHAVQRMMSSSLFIGLTRGQPTSPSQATVA